MKLSNLTLPTLLATTLLATTGCAPKNISAAKIMTDNISSKVTKSIKHKVETPEQALAEYVTATPTTTAQSIIRNMENPENRRAIETTFVRNLYGENCGGIVTTQKKIGYICRDEKNNVTETVFDVNADGLVDYKQDAEDKEFTQNVTQMMQDTYQRVIRAIEYNRLKLLFKKQEQNNQKPQNNQPPYQKPKKPRPLNTYPEYSFNGIEYRPAA